MVGTKTRTSSILWLLAGCLLCPLAAQAAMPAWDDLPLLLPGGGSRTQPLFRTRNLEGERIELFSPRYTGQEDPEAAASHWPVVPVPTGTPVSPQPGEGGFHWIQARQAQGQVVTVASTVHYFSNPAPAPRAMLQQPKAELEIVPTPLPREFRAYRAGETWTFLLRFRNQPLPHAPLSFHTEKGIQESLVSDAQGRVAVRMPEEASPPQTVRDPQGAPQGHARHDRPPLVRFALRVAHEADGTQYRTTFSQGYAPGPYAGKSLAMGAGFGLLGMLCATPLLRRPGKPRRAS